MNSPTDRSANDYTVGMYTQAMDLPDGAAALQAVPAAADTRQVQFDEKIDADQLLVGAWDRVPEVAEHLGVDAELLRAELDTYVRQLLRTRHAHTWALLEAFLSGRSQALETAA